MEKFLCTYSKNFIFLNQNHPMIKKLLGISLNLVKIYLTLHFMLCLLLHRKYIFHQGCKCLLGLLNEKEILNRVIFSCSRFFLILHCCKGVSDLETCMDYFVLWKKLWKFELSRQFEWHAVEKKLATFQNCLAKLHSFDVQAVWTGKQKFKFS